MFRAEKQLSNLVEDSEIGERPCSLTRALSKIIHEIPGAKLTGHLFDDMSALHTASCYS
jgi:hypothetical protein